MTASSTPSAAAGIFSPAPSPTPPARSTAPPRSLPSPPPKAARLLSSVALKRMGRRALAAAITVLVLIHAGGIARAAEEPGRYRGVLEGADYVINVPPGWK